MAERGHGEWLRGFVLPLVAGGDVRVSEVIGQRELDRLATASLDREEVSLAIAEARQAVADELVYRAPPLELDLEALRLAAAVQNLLFLSHPGARGLSIRKSRLAEVARFSAEAARLGEPEDVGELAARHSMLHHLFDLGRDDVRVTFWAGKREFRGAEPPPRLLKWGKVRRVREERWRVSVISEAVGDPLRREIVTALLEASPLTDLLEPQRLEPALDLGPLARWLCAPELARAVADRWLTLGLPAVAPALGAALLALYERGDSPAEARVATQFACHLHLLRLIATPPGARIASELSNELAMQPAMRDLFGIFAAAQRLGLGRPDDAGRDPRLGQAIDAYASACATLCGEARLGELVSLISRGAARPLPASAA